MDRFALNPIVLCHCQRYFAAVAAVVQQWRPAEGMPPGQLASVVGNLLWARSGGLADDAEQQEAMALTGALTAALGSTALGSTALGSTALGSTALGSTALGSTALGSAEDGGADALRLAVLRLLDDEERRVFDHYDAIVDAVAARLPDPPSGPAALNREVWGLLFPQVPYVCGSLGLQAAIRARLATMIAAR